MIHEELNRLPSKYRDPIILCDLENHTHEEAAQALHWPLGTVKGRLSRARNLLKDRLIRRGVGVPAVGVVLAIGREAKAIVSPALLNSTVRAAMSVAAGKGLVAGAASAVAVGLAQGVLQTMFWKSMKLGVAAIVAVGLIGVAGIGTFGQGPGGDGTGSSGGVGEPKPVDPSPVGLQTPAVPVANADEPPPEPDPNAVLRPTARAILGTWKVIARQDGDVDEIGLPFKDKVVITRDRIQLGNPGEADLTYGLNLLMQPKSLGMSLQSGPHKGTFVNAVFRLDGDRLTIAYMGLDHTGKAPGSVDNNQPGGNIFVVKLERVDPKAPNAETKPLVASPDADITKLQGSWVLWSQRFRRAGHQFDLGKIRNPLSGQMGSTFVISGHDIHDNQTGDNSAPVVARIESSDGRVQPKEINIRAVVDTLLPSRGIPVGKAIYAIEANHFTICYDPVHPDTRPTAWPTSHDDIKDDTRVVSRFERIHPGGPVENPTKKNVCRGVGR